MQGEPPLLGMPTVDQPAAAEYDEAASLAASSPPASQQPPPTLAPAPAPAPPRRRSSTLLTVCPFILGNEFCERLAFYGLQTNLVLYLTREMGESPAAASIQVMVFEGTCYLTPLLGAWLADSSWGRYRTILFFSVIYFTGMAALAGATLVPGLAPTPDTRWDGATLAQNLALFVPLYTVALGTGGIKPNVSAFGADQFDESDPRDAREKRSFFNWFYLFVNVGSLLAVTVVVWIQDAVSWSVGFAVPAAAMLCAIVVFVAGAGRYRHVTPAESPMARVVKVLAAAARNARAQRREAKAAAAAERAAAASLRRSGSGSGRSAAAAAAAGGGAYPSPSSVSLCSPLLQDASYRSAGGGSGAGSSLRGGNAFFSAAAAPAAAAGGGGGGSYDGPVNLPPGTPVFSPSSHLSPAPAPRQIPRPSSYQWLSFAEAAGSENGGGNGIGSGNGNDDGRLPVVGGGGLAGFTARQVEEVRMVVRMMPVFWTTAFYWAIYAQMGSFFVEQGQFMDRRLFFNFSDSPASRSSGSSSSNSPLSSSSKSLGRPFEVPAASLALFNTIAIIALVPLYDRGLLPLLRACGKRGPTLLQRIGWGLAVCALAMAAAAGVEQARLAKVAAGDVVPGRGGRHGGRAGNEVAALSVFWQVPQYLLVGASEVLASIGQLEFFYDQAPDVMRSCSMALQLLSVAVGSYLSGALVAAVGAGTAAMGWGKDGGGWLPSALNEGRLDLFFWFMAALCVANTLLFLAVASRYQYKDVPHGRRKRAAVPEEVVVVGGAGGEEQQAGAAATTTATPTAPPRPGRAPPTAARGIGAGAGGARRWGPFGGGSSPADSAFGRSVTYVPPSPALPAPFR